MALPTTAATDISNAILSWYMKGPARAQTIQDKPLLRILDAAKKTFPAGNLYIQGNVRGAYMESTASSSSSATAGQEFFHGYNESEQLGFMPSANILQYRYQWYETHAGLVITWSELKKTGVTITDRGSVSRHAGGEVAIITDLLMERYADYAESYAREKNEMLWKDGSQDSQVPPGILSILTDDPAVGTVGNLSRATYSWWRHRGLIGNSKITASATDQTLTKALRREMIQLRRYGGKPTRAICGSDFLEGMRLEIHEKGVYTQSGFTGTRDISMGDIRLDGLVFEYDPTLDDLGLSKRCYIIDTRAIRLMPMVGEDDKLAFPERPYDYAIFLKSLFWTGALVCDQPNANGIYEIA